MKTYRVIKCNKYGLEEGHKVASDRFGYIQIPGGKIPEDYLIQTQIIEPTQGNLHEIQLLENIIKKAIKEDNQDILFYLKTFQEESYREVIKNIYL